MQCLSKIKTDQETQGSLMHRDFCDLCKGLRGPFQCKQQDALESFDAFPGKPETEMDELNISIKVRNSAKLQ